MVSLLEIFSVYFQESFIENALRPFWLEEQRHRVDQKLLEEIQEARISVMKEVNEISTLTDLWVHKLRGDIWHRHCQRQCEILAIGIKFYRNNAI